jgi:tRNA threonylcarbamoyladenosine biosynthesis protein TsaB
VILVVDTSSARSALALLDEAGRVMVEELHPSGRTLDLPARFRAINGGAPVTKVAVATGPGSFTGLRVGVSFGLGLAVGLEIPIVPLPTLAIQAARATEPVLALAEAGRGRVYYLPPGGEAAIGDPAALPAGHRAVGWLRPATEAALAAAGVELVPDRDLRSFGGAAWEVLKSHREVPYGSVKLEYMQSFAASSR